MIWKESDINIIALVSKLSSMLVLYRYSIFSLVAFDPQLKLLCQDYVVLKEEVFPVDN